MRLTWGSKETSLIKNFSLCYTVFCCKFWFLSCKNVDFELCRVKCEKSNFVLKYRWTYKSNLRTKNVEFIDRFHCIEVNYFSKINNKILCYTLQSHQYPTTNIILIFSNNISLNWTANFTLEPEYSASFLN